MREPMPFPMIDLIQDPDSYVCLWRDGELHVVNAAEAR
jgi:hypothetical protein